MCMQDLKYIYFVASGASQGCPQRNKMASLL